MCLASAMGLALLGPERLVSGTVKYLATPSMIASGDGVEGGLGGVSASIARVTRPHEGDDRGLDTAGDIG